MFLYGTKLPDRPTFAENFADIGEAGDAAQRLWDASRDLGVYRDNTTAFDAAEKEAYARRIRAIHEATGVMIDNPALKPESTVGPNGQRTIRKRQDVEAEFRQALFDIAEAHPEHASAIGLDRPIREDAFAVMREAEARFADAAGAAASLPAWRRYANVLGGGFAGMMRDPVQVATLFAGGPISTGRSVGLRIAETMLTEAAVNAGVEALIQASGQAFRREAGVENGWGPALEQVGLAALFGGGAGGLIAGGGEVFRALGRSAPEGALERIAAGEALPEDVPALADALGLVPDPETMRTAALAAEQADLDRAAFGSPPEGLSPPEASQAAADAVRAIDNPPDIMPSADTAERLAQIERIVKAGAPLGRRPRQPQSLVEFLSASGGLADAAELRAMDLAAWRSRGYRKAIRAGGRTLDMAREAAEEAGYIGRAGDFQTTTVDDLLEAIREELGGNKRYSAQEQDLVSANALYEQNLRNRQEYRRMVERVDTAIDDLQLGRRPDDRVIARAAELVDDETDEVSALERALEEDYRAAADDLAADGEDLPDGFDIPFFDETADAGRVPGRSGEAGARGGETAAGDARAAGAPGGGLPRAGADEGEVRPLTPAGATPEPGTPEAAETAALVLTEATGAGEQTLIPGVKPVTTKERLEAQGAKPMKGGDAPPPEGGLFDLESRKQLDIWDAMPAAREADGRQLFTTHADMTADADRAGLFSDLIASCKD
jgi:hypothetical protein